MVNMLYEFSFGAFFLGLIILAGGGITVAYHQKIADNLASGVSSYERTKFWGLVACVVGCVVMLGLHSIPLNWLARSLFGGF